VQVNEDMLTYLLDMKEGENWLDEKWIFEAALQLQIVARKVNCCPRSSTWKPELSSNGRGMQCLVKGKTGCCCFV